MPKLRYDVKTRAVNAFAAALPEKDKGADKDVLNAVVAAIETLVHEGYIDLLPETRVCPECKGDKMTEGTIGFFACLRCGGRGRVPAV